MMADRTKYLAIGACAGAANGFFGSGGGLFLVPLFTGWLGMQQKHAFATSVAVIFPLSAVSAAVYFWKGGILLSDAMPYLLGGAVGGLLSGIVFSKVSVPLLRKAFALLLLWGGIRAVLLL